MKKILSLLAISGTALPTTIAASPYEKQENKLESNSENLIRNKRNIYNNNEIEVQQFLSTDRERFIFTLTPDYFEDLIYICKNSNANGINEYFKEKIPRLSGWTRDWTTVTVEMSKVILEKIDYFLNKWLETSRKNRVRFVIVEEYWRARFDEKWSYEDFEILNDNNSFENKRLNLLIEDFKNLEGNTGYYNVLTDLGIIDDDSDLDIKEKIRSYYPNLNLYTAQVKKVAMIFLVKIFLQKYHLMISYTLMDLQK